MSEAPSPGVLYRRAPHLAWRRVVEETVVLDLERRQVFGLSEEAAALLLALAEPRDLGQLAAVLAAGEAEPMAIVRLAGTLGELCGAGLVVTTAEASVAPGAADEPRAVLWREQLEEATQQVSPPMQIGNPQCLQ